MRKLNIVAIVLAVALLIGNVVQFLYWSKANAATIEKYTADIANLQLQIDSFGNRVTVYTVSSAVKAGDIVTADMLIPLDTYETMVTEQYITDTQNIVDRYFKIAVNPGTPLLSNMFMDEELDATVRDRDIILDRMTVGLQEGDYVDIRITLPYGDDYVVLSHKRIYALNEESVKLYLNEYEWNVYQGALIDYFLNAEYGCTLYADKYIEPGLQQEAVEFYAVPTNIANLLQKNPNIVDKKAASSLNEWREQMEQLLVLFRTDEDTIEADADRLSSGRDEWNEAVEADRETEAEARAEAEAEAAENAANGESVDDDFWATDATGG